MEKVKELARPWFEPAIIIAVILYVMDIQIDNVRTEIKGVQTGIQTEIDSVRTEIKGVNSRIDSLERILSRQDSEIKSTDKKIDDLKNSLISRKK